MKRHFMRSMVSLVMVLWMIFFQVSCGSSSGVSTSSSSSGSDFSTLSYAEATELTTTKGLSLTTAAGDLATSHSAFLTIDTDNDEITAIEEALTNFSDDLSTYTQLLEDMNSLEEIVFPDTSSSSLTLPSPEKVLLKFQSIDPSGVDSLNSVTDAMLAKKTECDALFALVPSLPSTPDEFAKLQAARDCAAAARLLAIQQGFDAAVVSGAGGVVGGAAGGAVIIYIGGTVLSGGGLIVVTIAGIIGSRIASYIWSGCSSGSSNLRHVLNASSSDSCAVASGSGSTDSAMVLQAVGTGSLQVYVEGCAPIIKNSVTIQDGQTLTVSGTCQELGDDVAADDVESNNDATTSEATDTAESSCGSVLGISATNSPADPGPSDAVTVTAKTVPVASGCSVSYSMSGTDGYSTSGTLTTDSSGSVSFTIPAAGQEGIVDTIQITESASAKATTLTYVF